MNELISRQAAVDAPKIFTKDCNPEHFVGHSNFIEYMDTVGIRSFGNWQYANGFNMGLTAAEVAIEKLPSAQQWIPVTERLPGKNGDYYVTYEKRYAEDYGLDPVGIAPYDADCEGFGIWQERYDPVSLGYLDRDFVDIKVTAWMPYIRPEPWEGESDGRFNQQTGGD